MSDTEAQVSAEGEAQLTPDDIAQRGVGVKVENLDPERDAAAIADVEAFKQLTAEYNAADAALEELKNRRNAAVKDLKDKHNISFSSIADIIGNTSSLVLYIYERASGKTSKQIREDSQKSAAAKALYRESDPNKKPVRKQSSAEKELRKQQREALKAFLENEKAAKAAAGEDTADEDAALADVADEEAAG